MNLLSEITDEEIKADILHKLFRKKKWGGSHTAFENLYKWCEKRYAHRYKKVGEMLIKEGLLISKPTSYGLQVSLNPRKKSEIITIIRRWFEKDVF